MKNFLFTALAAGISLTSLPVRANFDLTLEKILNAAAEMSPDVAAARMREVAAERKITQERAGFLPNVEFQAADTSGFPSSTTSGLEVSGLVGSPFRSGAAAGIVANVPIWDFGRTWNSVDAAQHEWDASREATKYRRYEVYQTALRLFYDCALDRELSEAWQKLAEDVTLVKNVVDGFINTGQISIVERYLVESEVVHAKTEIAFFRERYQRALHEIQVFTGINESDFQCQHLPDPDNAAAMFHGTPLGNPSVTHAAAKLDVARARVDKASSENMPKLLAAADVGVMQDTRVVPNNQYYAIGASLVIPIFEGFRIQSEEDQARAEALSAERELANRKLEIDTANAHYDKAIHSIYQALTHLDEEMRVADKGFDVAKKRFFKMEGTAESSAVDVRDAYHNYSRVRLEFIQEKGHYAAAVGAKALLNGTPFGGKP